MTFLSIEILITIIVGAIYIAFIGYYLLGWIKIPLYISKDSSQINLSVIIAARNEDENILNILSDLKSQTYNSNNFEVLIIDDNSTDNTYKKANEFCKINSNFQVLKLENGHGKKPALNLGIRKSKHNLILATDADCSLGRNWIRNYADYYEKHKPVYISAPVIIEHLTLFENIQAVEFLSLNAIGAAAISNKYALYSNGANLAFEKDKYLEISDAYNNNVASGDDVFFMHELKNKYSDRIMFLKSKDSIVRTQAAKSFSEFINQRKRWVSKSKNYKDSSIVVSGLITFFVNIYVSILFITAIINSNYILPFVIIFSIKLSIDLVFLIITNSFYKIKNVLILAPIIEIIYIFYIPIISIYGNIGNFKWKDRILKK